MGSCFIICYMWIKFWGFSPRLFDYKSRVKFCKLSGRCFSPSTNPCKLSGFNPNKLYFRSNFILYRLLGSVSFNSLRFYGLSPKLFHDKFNVRFSRFLGKFVSLSDSHFMSSSVNSSWLLQDKSRYKLWVVLGRCLSPSFSPIRL